MNCFFIERITDISNDLCGTMDAMQPSVVKKDRAMVKVLSDLYVYHRSNEHVHPLTNWHAHRLRCMSCIATKLHDVVKIWECHYFILQYIYERSQCDCHVNKHVKSTSPSSKVMNGVNHDFYHRDSLNYLVYGSQALANACAYLKQHTHYNYGKLFEPIICFLRPYMDGTKTHREYVNSQVLSDCEKPEYDQPWQPSYASTFFRILREDLGMNV